MTNSHERKVKTMDRSTHYRKIYQDTITRAGIVEGRPLTDYEKGVLPELSPQENAWQD